MKNWHPFVRAAWLIMSFAICSPSAVAETPAHLSFDDEIGDTDGTMVQMRTTIHYDYDYLLSLAASSGSVVFHLEFYFADRPIAEGTTASVSASPTGSEVAVEWVGEAAVGVHVVNVVASVEVAGTVRDLGTRTIYLEHQPSGKWRTLTLPELAASMAARVAQRPPGGTGRRAPWETGPRCGPGTLCLPRNNHSQ